MKNQGTPKHLMESIANGIVAWDTRIGQPPISNIAVEDQARQVEMHVRDFLSQRFSSAIMEAESAGRYEEADRLMNFFKWITEKELPPYPFAQRGDEP